MVSNFALFQASSSLIFSLFFISKNLFALLINFFVLELRAISGFSLSNLQIFIQVNKISLQINTDFGNHSSSNGGSWTITRGSAGQPLVISKTAGTYSGGGYWFVNVYAGNYTQL